MNHGNMRATNAQSIFSSSSDSESRRAQGVHCRFAEGNSRPGIKRAGRGHSVGFQITKHVEKDGTLDRAQKAVLTNLALRADEYGYCFPHEATIANAIDWCVRSVRAALRKLERRGYVYIGQRMGASGNHHAYMIVRWMDFANMERALLARFCMTPALAVAWADVYWQRRFGDGQDLAEFYPGWEAKNEDGRAANSAPETGVNCRFEPAKFAGSPIYRIEDPIEDPSTLHRSLVVVDHREQQQQAAPPTQTTKVDEQLAQTSIDSESGEWLQVDEPRGIEVASATSTCDNATERIAPRPTPQVATRPPSRTPTTQAARGKPARAAGQRGQPSKVRTNARGETINPKSKPAKAPALAVVEAERAAILARLDGAQRAPRLALLEELAQITSAHCSLVETLLLKDLRSLVEWLPKVVRLLNRFGYGEPEQPSLEEGIKRWYEEVWKQTSIYQNKKGYPDIDWVVALLPGLGKKPDPSSRAAVYTRDRRLVAFNGLVLGLEAEPVEAAVDAVAPVAEIEPVVVEAAPAGALMEGNRDQRTPCPACTSEQAKVWRDCLVELKLSMPSAVYNDWVRDVQLVAVIPGEDGKLGWRLGTPNKQSVAWLNNQLVPQIKRMVASLIGQTVAVEFVAQG